MKQLCEIPATTSSSIGFPFFAPDSGGARVGLTYDLRTEYRERGLSEEEVAEFDSEETIEALADAIASAGHRVDRIGSAQSLCRRLVSGDRWDLVFNIAEGLGGRCREAQVPAILEAWSIPYTFSDPLVCALTLDKALAKRQVACAGLCTPRSVVVAEARDATEALLRFPLFVKPNAEGTGKGIDARSRVDSPNQLSEACAALISRGLGPVLVEEYLPGREFTVGVIGTGGSARILGTMEIEIRAQAGRVDYTFEAKEKCESLVRYSTPPMDELRRRVEALALACYRRLECRDAGRVDIRLNGDGEAAFLEVNPLPGLHPHHSDLPMIATRAGMAYEKLIGSIIESAMTRTEPVVDMAATGEAAVCGRSISVATPAIIGPLRG